MSNDTEILSQRVHYNLLYDYYSPLLTDRQRKVYEMLYFTDLTLTEAGEALGISRQAVYLLAHNVTSKLDSLEHDLKFAQTVHKLEAENAELRGKLREKEEER